MFPTAETNALLKEFDGRTQNFWAQRSAKKGGSDNREKRNVMGKLGKTGQSE